MTIPNEHNEHNDFNFFMVFRTLKAVAEGAKTSHGKLTHNRYGRHVTCTAVNNVMKRRFERNKAFNGTPLVRYPHSAESASAVITLSPNNAVIDSMCGRSPIRTAAATPTAAALPPDHVPCNVLLQGSRLVGDRQYTGGKVPYRDLS